MTQQTLEERLESYRLEKGCKGISSNKLLLAASAVAGVGAIVVPPPAEAAIVYSGVQNKKVTVVNRLQTVDFDNNADVECTFKLLYYNTTYTTFSQNLAVAGTASVIKSNGVPARLSPNYSISSKVDFEDVEGSEALATSISNGGNFLGQKGFLGVKFKIDTDTHYGWIQYEAENDATVGTIIDWAYEDVPDKAIKAGVTKMFNWTLFLPAIINDNMND